MCFYITQITCIITTNSVVKLLLSTENYVHCAFEDMKDVYVFETNVQLQFLAIHAVVISHICLFSHQDNPDETWIPDTEYVDFRFSCF